MNTKITHIGKSLIIIALSLIIMKGIVLFINPQYTSSIQVSIGVSWGAFVLSLSLAIFIVSFIRDLLKDWKDEALKEWRMVIPPMLIATSYVYFIITVMLYSMVAGIGNYYALS